jgi:SAM-dependent methyltransferase
MLPLSPSRDDGDARSNLEKLLNLQLCADAFKPFLRELHTRFSVYAATCPVPLPAPGLIITPEIRLQSELYLPVAEITEIFELLYRASLSYSPIFESCPFHKALSWADVFVSLPQRFQFSPNPACLLEKLISHPEFLVEFLFASFLPRRFYGGFRRYPQQSEFLGSWLSSRTANTLHCLDAACGTGESSYDLVMQLLQKGFLAEDFNVEGWTIEPLEVWSAAHARFPHDSTKEADYHQEIEAVFTFNAADRILFRTVDLRESTIAKSGSEFDLILCNGLLGGPILTACEVQSVVAGLSRLLVPGGIIIAADRFHGGWKQKHPQDWLRVQFESVGLEVFAAGEGLCARMVC